MRKVVSILLCAVMAIGCAFAFAGCTPAEKLSYDVVLITDGGTVSDGSYNQSAWAGVSEFAESADMTSRYYQPVLDESGIVSAESAMSYVDLAVKSGAKYIVLPTAAYENAAYEGAEKYADVKFILIDGAPKAENGEAAKADNLMSVSFDDLQSGFLAGYNAVISGNQKLGYFGENTEKSRAYGSGYIQGAAYAADSKGIPITVDYADYDSPQLNYSYSFTVKANYKKISEIDEDVFKINVVNGTGSGVYTEGSNVTLTADPAPEGKVFDRWEVKSDTEGVKDSKVNLSTKTKPSTNLLVEKCDATITAAYKDAEDTLYPVTVMNAGGGEYTKQFAASGASLEVIAPAAAFGTVFDHWNINSDDEGVIDDLNAKDTWVHIGEAGLTLEPVYVKSVSPTFDVTVVTGEGGEGESSGSGAYQMGDRVSLSAALPKDGYIFYNWSNADEDGYGAGISMENEYYPITSFEMVNRYKAVVEKMYNKGVSIVYAGGNTQGDVVSDATWSYNFPVAAIGSEIWQSGWTNYYSSSVKDYAAAVKACLNDFKGGESIVGNCANKCVAMSYVDEKLADDYNAVYAALGDGKIAVKPAVSVGSDVSGAYPSKCLTVNYWIEK